MVKFYPAGDSALLVEFGDIIDPDIAAQIRAFTAALRQSPIDGIREWIPTFRSVTVLYDPLILSYSNACKKASSILENIGKIEGSEGRAIGIPVCYGLENPAFGEDLTDMEALTGLSKEEIIQIHSSRDYLIYMLGFLPGFAYLGGLDERIAVPRLENPRTRIEAGSIGIGGNQTGIYPLDSPGGWRLIGRTPVRPFMADRREPFLYKAGDTIRFVPIDENEYHRLLPLCAADQYQCEIY